MIGTALLLARKDILSDLRTMRAPALSVVFSLMVMATFRYAFADYGDFEIHSMSLLAAATIWSTITLSGTLSISRGFFEERDNGCINALLMCPHDPSAIYLGKFISNFWRVALPGLFSLVWFVAFFGMPGKISVLPFLLVCIAGMGGISILGSYVAPVAARCSSGRETLFMIMLLPLVLGILVLSVLATASIFEGSGMGGIFDYVVWLILMDSAYFLVAALSFEFAVTP